MVSMEVLVTGSRGFIGRKIVEELKKRKYAVKEFDLELGNDLLKEKDCEGAVKGVNVVIHLAAELNEESPLLWKVNVDGTKNLVKAAAKNRVGRFIFASSVGVYGDTKERVDEESEFAPKTDYEKSKVEAEKVLEGFQEEISITILRPAIVLGANKYWEKNLKVVRKGFPLIGNGGNKWQTVDVKDVVSAVVFVLERKETEGEDYIVAEENASSLKELILEMKKNLGMEEKVWGVPEGLGKILFFFYITFFRILGKDVGFRVAHIDRLCRDRFYSVEKLKKLSWKPEYDMKKSVKEMVQELS